MKAVQASLISLVLLLAAFFTGLFVGSVAGVAGGNKVVRLEAVRAGVAHYVADDDGRPQFEWILPDREKP